MYFFYLGELKNYGLCVFLREALSRIYNKRFDFIAIVPDILEQYNYKNVIAVNPGQEDHCKRYNANVSCRVTAAEFARAVSQDSQIRSLVKEISQKQDGVFIYMYESLIEMTLDEMAGVSLLGPDKGIAKRVNNKSFQMQSLENFVPIVDFRICNGYESLQETCERLFHQWKDGIFVTKEYSAAGVNSIVAHNLRDIKDRFDGQDVPYIVTRFLPHIHDPTVLGVVANPQEVYIAGVADQCIQGGNRFTGSTFPSILPADLQEQLITLTRNVGSWLAEQGYRGVFGCDYIITESGEIRFLEINARKQGTTLEFCCTLEQSLPKGSPMLPELEYYAVRYGKFPESTIEPKGNVGHIHWGTYNYKIHEPVITSGYIPHAVYERESFKKIATKDLLKDYLILEHTGSDLFVTQGSFVARVVALGHDHQSVRDGIEQGQRMIELTFTKHSNDGE